MALLEKEETRFAEALDDYEHVSVTDIGGWGPSGFWVVVLDHRFDINHYIHDECREERDESNRRVDLSMIGSRWTAPSIGYRCMLVDRRVRPAGALARRTR